jgi:hypothetical protein
MASYPNTEGFEYSFSSIILKARGKRYYGATNISYDDGLEPGVVEGTSTLPLGETAGKWSGNGSLEMNRRDGQALIDDLGDGYGRVRFSITVQYAEEGMPVITDELPSVRIKKVTNNNSAGTDPSKMTFELSLLKPIKRNGKAIERSIDTTGTANL